MTMLSKYSRIWRPAILAVAASLPAACVSPSSEPARPANPFFGAWTSGERDQIAFRDNTVVQSPPGGPATALGPESCGGKFGFSYSRKSRDALLATVGRQLDLRQRLTGLLPQSEYPVAELRCEEGNSTYVLVNERDLVAIYQDGDIAALQHLSRL